MPTQVSVQGSSGYIPERDKTQAVLVLLRSLPQPIEMSAIALARSVECHEATVRRALTRLEGQGLVIVERRRGLALRVTCVGIVVVDADASVAKSTEHAR